MDQATTGQAWAAPGMDPRQWVSMGTVSADDPSAVVIFDEDEGQQLVQVTLQPSKIPVFCRVASQAAGNGEADFSPWVQGDEVIVLIPEGSEDSGCVIVGRMNNAIDKFPFDSVAGQDPTTNTFAFTRRRTPMVQEFAGPILFRSALNDGLISISTSGVVTIKDSENSVFQMSPDVIGFQGPSSEEDGTSPEFLMQLNLTDEQFTLQIKDAIINFSSSTATPEQNTISVPGPMTIGTSSNPPLEHVVTTEALCNILIALGLVATTAKATSGWLPLQVTAAISLAATTPIESLTLAAITGVFAIAPQKLNTGGAQTNPGIGCSGLLVG